MDWMLNEIDELLSDFVALVGEPEVLPGWSESDGFYLKSGVRLPEDYLLWAQRYSTIEICNELLVNNLVAARINQLSRKEFAGLHDGVRVTRDILPHRIDVLDSQSRPIGPRPWLPVFPELGGIIAWGNDNNGAQYFWDTSISDPNQWTILIYDGTWQEFDCGFLEFLINLLRGAYLNSPLFMDCWPWIPAIREYRGDIEDGEVWNIPARWQSYFSEYYRRRERGMLRYDKVSLRWAEEFR
jgi:hypothetical protein